MGTPRDLLGGDGSVRWSAAYTAWGKIHDEYSATNTTRGPPTDPDGSRETGVRSPFRLLGQYYDEETGLSATRFRMWEAETGRWLSPDPVGVFGGANLLGFNGSPTANVDRLGLSCTSRATGLGDTTTSPWLADPRVGVRSHLEMFRNGGSWVMTRKQYDLYVRGNSSVGDPSGQYISTRAGMDRALSSGNIATIEKNLGFDPGHFSRGGGLVRIDVNNPLLHNVRMPSGLERGANEHFRPGGYTSGGAPEAVINPAPVSDATISFL